MTATTERLETGHEPDTAVSDSVLRQFVLSQSAMNGALVAASGGRHEVDGELSLTDTGSVVPYLNQAVLFRPVVDAADIVLDRIDGFFGSRALATVLSVWPTPDLTPRGWVLLGHPMFVVAPPRGVVPAEPPLGVVVERVTTPQGMADAERVLVDGYPIEQAAHAASGAVLKPALLNGELEVWLGNLDGEPVGVGAALAAHGLVNLAMDATLPAARRRGVWRAIVAARAGSVESLPTVAFTSDFSRPGFVAMGFLPITRFTLWARPV
jgi:hypothetical protein